MQQRPQPQNQYSAMPIEKIIAAMSYLTFGWVGFLWLLIAIFTKNNLRPFIKYHIFQSIFLSFGYFVLCLLAGLLMNALSIIPFVNLLVIQISLFLNMPVILGFSLIQTAVFAILAYLAFGSIQGKYSYLPWVSDIIKANLRMG